jgi:hypothetical protein
MPFFHRRLRRRLLVDRQVQGAFLLRVGLYWLTCVVAGAVLVIGWQRVASLVGELSGQPAGMNVAGPLILGTVLLLPVLIYDTLVLSNKLVGPLNRMRGLMRQVAQGKPVSPIHFRQGDFWQECAEEFNAVLARIKDLEQERDLAVAACGSLHSALAQPSEEPAEPTTA